MKKLKRLLGLLLSLTLVIGMFPGMSLTAYAAAQYKEIGSATNTPRSLPSDFVEVTLEEATAYDVYMNNAFECTCGQVIRPVKGWK